MVKEQTIVTGMAGRYATALYELAKENNAVEDVVAALRQFRDMARESDDLRRLIRSPVIPAEAQVKALDAILAKDPARAVGSYEVSPMANAIVRAR